MSTWTVPGYTDIRQLGHNGFGRTILASHIATGVPVTIRYLADELRQDDAYLSRYRAEARVLCDVESPNVAELYEYVESGDGVAAVREYVNGASLRALLASSSTLHPEAALSVLKGGLLGLATAHARGATHRRCTPENVLIDQDGRTKLSDFGVAAADGAPADDVRAAFATFLRCLTGSGAAAPVGDSTHSRGRIPKRLNPLVRTAASGDCASLLGELDALATKAYGEGWESQGRKRLARHASRRRARANR